MKTALEPGNFRVSVKIRYWLDRVRMHQDAVVEGKNERDWNMLKDLAWKDLFAEFKRMDGQL